jgi:hypothetical protein
MIQNDDPYKLFYETLFINKNFEEAEEIIKKYNLNLNSKNYKTNLLNETIKNHDKSILTLLIKHGIDLKINHSSLSCLVYYFTREINDFEIFKILVDNGADINKIVSVHHDNNYLESFTMAMLSIWFDKYNCFEYIINNENFDIKQKNNENETLFEYCINNCYQIKPKYLESLFNKNFISLNMMLEYKKNNEAKYNSFICLPNYSNYEKMLQS